LGRIGFSSVYLAVHVASSDHSNALQDFIICTYVTDMWALLSAGTRSQET
jgi:hypothetical protein